MVVTVLISIPEREAAVHSNYMRGSAEVLCRIYLCSRLQSVEELLMKVCSHAKGDDRIRHGSRGQKAECCTLVFVDNHTFTMIVSEVQQLTVVAAGAWTPCVPEE
jgi:hypothetical protein